MGILFVNNNIDDEATTVAVGLRLDVDLRTFSQI